MPVCYAEELVFVALQHELLREQVVVEWNLVRVAMGAEPMQHALVLEYVDIADEVWFRAYAIALSAYAAFDEEPTEAFERVLLLVAQVGE